MAPTDVLDPGYETDLYAELPPEAQRAVVEVAGVIAGAYDMTHDIALPVANRVRRDDRELFDRLLNRDAQDDAREEQSFNARAMYDDMPPHIQAEIRPVAADNLRGGLSMQRAMEEAIRTVLARHPDFVDQELRARGFVGVFTDETGDRQPIFQGPPARPGFVPFSGAGRCLYDLDSLD